MPSLNMPQQYLVNILSGCNTLTESSKSVSHRGVGLTALTPSFPNGFWFEKDFNMAVKYASGDINNPGSTIKCRFVSTVEAKHNLQLIVLNQSIFQINQHIYPALFNDVHQLHQTLANDIKVVFSHLNLHSHDGIFMQRTNEYFIVDPAASFNLIKTTIV